MSYTFDSWRPSDEPMDFTDPAQEERNKKRNEQAEFGVCGVMMATGGLAAMVFGVIALRGKDPEMQKFILENGYNSVKYGLTILSAGLGMTALGSYIFYRNLKEEP